MKVITGRCWVSSKVPKPDGYVQTNKGYAHRVSYETLVGPIPDNLDLDHVCRNRSCYNPSHLEPVTRQENMIRAFNHRGPTTHCKSCGREKAGDNLYMDRGYRKCLSCKRKTRLASYHNTK